MAILLIELAINRDGVMTRGERGDEGKEGTRGDLLLKRREDGENLKLDSQQ